MLLDDDESSDQRVAILAALSKTQAVIARKRAAVVAVDEGGVEEDVAGGDASEKGHRHHHHHHHHPRSHSAGYVSVREHRSEFFDLWSQKVEAFVSDAGKTALELPAELSANDRRELHQLAEKFNLSHMSEGHGTDRHLVLRKDQLHYKAPEYRPSANDLNALRNAPAARGQIPPTQQQRSIESRFALRRVRASDDEPKYADADAERALRRLEKATDHYRHAVEVGMTMEELLRGEQKSLEDTLAEEGVPGMPATSAAQLQQKRAEVAGTESRAWAGVLAAAATAQEPVASNAKPEAAGERQQHEPQQFDEQCLSCGTRVRVDYDVDSWTCCGQCPVCRKETIWRLVEVLAAAPREEIEKDDEEYEASADEDGGGNDYQRALVEDEKARAGKKRARQDDGDGDGERDRDLVEAQESGAEDESGLSELLGCATVDEAVELATVNDVPPEDIEFLRWFAACLVRSNVPLSSKLLFVIDFDELCEVVPFAPPRPGSKASRVSRPLFVRTTAVEGVAGGSKPIHATKILREVLQCVCSAEEGSAEQVAGEGRVTVAFPSTSLYGSVLSLVVRIEGPSRAQDRWWTSTGLPNLEKKFGVKHLRVEGDIRDLLRD